jgi:coatomer protein complex subunit epsilon
MLMNRDSVAYIVQIYLSINRPDLAKAQFEASKRWAEDDLLLQLIESSIGLSTGRDAYSDPLSFYTEQVANPSFTSARLFTARGVTRLLRGDVADARSDFDEALGQLTASGNPAGVEAETAAASAVAASLAKAADADDLWKWVAFQFSIFTWLFRTHAVIRRLTPSFHSGFMSKHAKHPLAVDVAEKMTSFDEFASAYTVPSVAVA